MPFNDLSGAINVKYLQNSNISMFKILFLPVIYSDKYKYFRMIDEVLECESQDYANP